MNCFHLSRFYLVKIFKINKQTPGYDFWIQNYPPQLSLTLVEKKSKIKLQTAESL